YGYVSAIQAFVRFVTDTDRKLPSSLKCIITTSELLDSISREFLESRSGLRVYNEYGCGEVGSIAHECESGRLHVMSDNVVLECVPSESKLPDGLGELLVTDLHNTAMPLIRYKLGDLGRLSDGNCDCGRPYPVLDKIVGRAYDIIVGIDGRKYHPESILYVFEDLARSGFSLPPFQATQHQDGELTIRFQAVQDLAAPALNALNKAFSDAFGTNLTVTWDTAQELPR